LVNWWIGDRSIGNWSTGQSLDQVTNRPIDQSTNHHYHSDGDGCGPVAATVFKIAGRSRRAGGGGFDSHPSPPSYNPMGCHGPSGFR